MTRPDSDLHVVHLLPGDVAIEERPSLFITVLGSCVAVTLWDVRTHVGAMCHGVLPAPGWQEKEAGSPRYVEPAILRMLSAFRAFGVRREDIRVKLFGGGEVLAVPEESRRRVPSVGSQNVEKALEVLAGKGLPLCAADVGGVRGRKILFNTRTGEVLLRRLSKPGPGAR